MRGREDGRSTNQIRHMDSHPELNRNKVEYIFTQGQTRIEGTLESKPSSKTPLVFILDISQENTRREKIITKAESILIRIFSQIIIEKDFNINITLKPLSLDGSLIPNLINTTSMLLLNACINIRHLVFAVNGSINKNTIKLDLIEQEEKDRSIITIARSFKTPIPYISYLHLKETTLDQYKQVSDQLALATERIGEILLEQNVYPEYKYIQ
ncbi:hypothetical protein NEOKW01_0163 [Nematocida sp. AWRm80]|nr:hypothetical protein NEOKW01_0163 [Nematocida sp. AWRm80]